MAQPLGIAKAAAAGDVAALGGGKDEGAITALMVACRFRQLAAVEAVARRLLDR